MKYNSHLIKTGSHLDLVAEMEKIGADPAGIKIMAPKAELKIVKAEQLSLKAVNILKQEMLSRGGDVVVHKEVSMLKKDFSDVLIIGTRKQYWELIHKLKVQPFGLKELATELQGILRSEHLGINEKTLIGNHREIHLGNQTLVMGILNITPDSFSDGGKYIELDLALERAKEMIEFGADIIDIGGESTRPGHAPVSMEEEIRRVIPIIKKLSNEIDVPISIDTYKAEVAKQAILAGANIINDVWGFKKDPEMAKVAAELGVPVILMHNREQPVEHSLMEVMIKELRESIFLAIQAGVREENIILDPGIGFGKTYQDNLIVMNRLDEIVSLGFPVLLGTSRKSFIGLTLDLPVEDRIEGTSATVALGISKGCKIVRVHDVKEMKRVCKMMDAMIYVNNKG